MRSSLPQRLIFVLLFSCFALCAATAETPRAFDLPAGPADAALKLFSAQSGRSVVFSTEAVRELRTRRVEGKFIAREALDLLVAGTGLVATADENTGAFALSRPTPPNIPRTAPAPVTAQKDSADPTLSPAIELSPFEVRADDDAGY